MTTNWEAAMAQDRPETLRDWETVQQDSDDSKTQRLRVVGGWLYRTRAGAAVAMAFVPEFEAENRKNPLK